MNSVRHWMLSLLIAGCLYPFFGFSQVQSGKKFQIQKGNNLIYFVGSASLSNDNQYLVPFIESELIKLRSYKDSTPIFKEIRNLNIYASKESVDITFAKLFKLFGRDTGTFVANSSVERMRQTDSVLRENLKSNDLILRININTLGTLIEYQFILFQVITDPKNNKVTADLTSYRSISVFVDPSGQDYKEKLRYTLRQLINEANTPPKPVLLINNNEVSANTYWEVGIPLKLQAAEIDFDSPKDQMKYSWSITDSFSQTTIRNFPSSQSQDYTPQKLGVYQVTLHVNDGVNDSAASFVLTIVNKPVLYVTGSKNRIWDLSRRTLNIFSFNNRFNLSDFFGQTFTDTYPVITISTDRPSRGDISVQILRPKNISLPDSSSSMIKVPVTYGSSPDDDFDYTLNQSDSSHSRSTHSYDYTIMPINNNPAQKKGIINPSTDYIKITAAIDNIESSELIKVRYHKICRVNPYIEYSYLFGSKDSTEAKFYYVNFGALFLLDPILILNLSLGLAQHPSGDFSYELSKIYTWKAELITPLIRLRPVGIFAGVSYFQHPLYINNKSKDITRNASFGVKLDCRFGPKFNDYFFGGLSSYDIFGAAYYNKKSNNITTSPINMYEVGVRLSFYFEKRLR